jgi:hypothetical protein
VKTRLDDHRHSHAARWPPARVFLAVSAGGHLVLATAGFVDDRTFPIGAHAAAASRAGHVFGVFETNGWHTLGALVIGLVSLAYAVRGRGARSAALSLGVSHIVLFGLLVVADPSTFWIASNIADQAVHASTAVGGTLCALFTPRGLSTPVEAASLTAGS